MRSARSTYRCFIVLFLALFPSLLKSNSKLPIEKIHLLTDRSVYVSGERVLFSGYLDSKLGENDQSKVAYIELLTPQGQKINQCKVKIDSSYFKGELPFLPDVLSGYYFIRAYTKYMRNGRVEDYAYERLKIINPYNSDVLELNDSLIDQSLSIKDSIALQKITKSEVERHKVGDQIKVNMDEELDKNVIQSISIIPSLSFQNSINDEYKQLSGYDSLIYYPETRSLSLSGKLWDKKKKKSIPYHKISVHLKDEKDFISVLSDSLGRFLITLPNRYENIEFFLIAAPNDKEQIEILVDQDFCQRPFSMSVPPFSIKEEEKFQFLKVSQSFQLSKIFSNSEEILKDSLEKNSFYGKADKSIDFDEYIGLDSLSQYFTDLPSWINVKRSAKKRSLYISGPEVELQLYPPLMLIDWVPVEDAEKILRLDPRRIRNFEVITSPYIHGSIIYGGIINIFSRNNDFAGYQFPNSAMYVNYTFFNSRSMIKEESPFKNTFEWIPNNTGQNHSFDAPSLPGEYIILINSIRQDGKQYTSIRPITVEAKY